MTPCMGRHDSTNHERCPHHISVGDFYVEWEGVLAHEHGTHHSSKIQQQIL